MYKVLALAAVVAALPTTVLAQTPPATAPTTAATAAPAVVSQRDHDRDGGHQYKTVPGCGDIGSFTARGTITYPSCTVPSNHTLIQGGYSNQSVKRGGNTASYPNSLIRFGTSVRGLELDIAPPTIERISPAVGKRTGVTDIGAGLTYQLPSFGPIHATINGLVFAPTADSGFGSRTGSNNQIGLNLGTSLAGFGIGGSARFESTIDPLTGIRYQSFVPSVAIGHQLAFGTVFAEAARFSRVTPFGNPEMLYTAGYKVALSNRAQLDAEYSFSPSLLGQRAQTIGAGFGFLF
jgi:hypothetical protein